MRALLRAISYAVIVGVGIDAFFFAWLLAEDQGGLSRGRAQVVAAIAAVLVSAAAWVVASLARSSRTGRLVAAAARRTAVRAADRRRDAAQAATSPTLATTMVASSPLASATAQERAAVFALLDRRAEAETDDVTAADPAGLNQDHVDDDLRDHDPRDIDGDEGRFDGTAQIELPRSQFRLSRFDLNADSSTISTFEFEKYDDEDEFETVLPPAAPLFATPAVGTASVAGVAAPATEESNVSPEIEASTDDDVSPVDVDEPSFLPTPRTDSDPIGSPGFVLADSVDSARAALAEATEQYGNDDPRTLRTKAVLACAHWAVGDLDQAIGVYEETVLEAESVFGEDHPETLTWRGDLAAAYELDGRLDEAIELYAWALEGRERALGRNHPDTQQVRSNLAIATAVRANLTRGRA